MDYDPRRSIARLAAAVIVADAHVTSSEIASLAGLVRLGLGSLEGPTRAALALSSEEPLDAGAACLEIVARYPDAGATILATLTEIAASDGQLDPRELALLAQIGAALGVAAPVANEIVRTVAADAGASDAPDEPHHEAPGGAAAPSSPAAAPPPSERPASPLAGAYTLLGLVPGAPRTAVEDAYRALIDRYQPAKVIDLGPEFAVLAVRRLGAETAAFTARMGQSEGV